MKEISQWRTRHPAPGEETRSEFFKTADLEEISLSAYWNIIVKNRKIILAISLLVSVVGAYFALSATTLYSASARISIEPQNPRVTGVGELQPLDLRLRYSGEYDYHQTQFALLQSRPLAARVITDLGLATNKAFINATVVSPNPVNRIKSWMPFLTSYIAPLFKAESQTEVFDAIQQSTALGKPEPELSVPSPVIDEYLGFITVEPIKQTRLVSVQFTTPSPALSQALANAHVQAFMRMSLESRFSLTQEARDFLQRKKNELQQKLENSEAELNRFRRAHGVLSVEKGENIVVDRLVELNKQLTAARAQRIEAESLLRTVENRNHQNLAEIMRQGLVQQLKANLASLEAENTRLSTIFKPEHPRIQDLNEQIVAARRALNDEVTLVVRGIRSNYAAALAKERGLESEAEKQQQDALQLRELGVQYTVLQEDVNANRSLYEGVLKRLSETNVSNDVAVSNMQIVERAAKPLRASGPNVPLYLLASIVSGLFLGVGSAFLREFFDSTVSTPDEVWRSVGLATLGVVPHLKFLDRPTYSDTQLGTKQAGLPRPSRAPAKELITQHGPLSIMNDAYRTIRTSLLLSQAEKPPQVILLTSPSPGDGKTVTSLNLAIALARDEHTVLLVDADMRMGCCHNRLGLTNNRGLSNIMTGHLTLDEGIQDTYVSGLSLLSRGVPPPNPSELLGSRKMKDVLKELRQRFDFILIDSTPVIGISDAAILSVIADAVLLVFDAQKTSTVHAQKAVESLDIVRARLLGVILNAVDLDNPDFSYYRNHSRYYSVSNQNEMSNEFRTKDFSEGLTFFNNTGEFKNGRQAESRNSHPGYGGSGENATQTPEANCAKLFVSENLRGGHDRATFKSPHAPQTTTGNGSLRRSKPDGTVSEAFLERLTELFTDAIGPMGTLIVREQITVLGESHKAFPKFRIDELIKSIEQEIVLPEIRLQFQKQIADEMRNTEIH